MKLRQVSAFLVFLPVFGWGQVQNVQVNPGNLDLSTPSAGFNLKSGQTLLGKSGSTVQVASGGLFISKSGSTFTVESGATTSFLGDVGFSTQIAVPKIVYSGSVTETFGAGSPEGVVAAAIGSIYHRTDGSTGTTIYVKESGSSNTGWRALSSGGSGTVVGPVSSVTDRIATYADTTGALIQDGGKKIVDINPQGKHTIYIPAAAMIPATTNGCASLAQVELTAGHPEVITLNFDPSTEQYALFSVQMPKSWDLGTVTVIFIWSHPSTSTNFGTVWGAQAVAVSSGDGIDTAYGTAQTVVSTGGTTNTLYISGETSAITIAGTPAAGDHVFFRVYRKAADGSDTLAVAARLHGIRILYSTNLPNDS